jgi:hypothetical protein
MASPFTARALLSNEQYLFGVPGLWLLHLSGHSRPAGRRPPDVVICDPKRFHQRPVIGNHTSASLQRRCD